MSNTGRPARVLVTLALSSLGLALLTGCPPGPRNTGVAPRTVDEAIARVNQNLRGFDQTLMCKGLVTIRFREIDGPARTFALQDANLLFHPPQFVRFSINTLAGETAQVGSNDQRYWVWVDTDPRRMWWGTWERAGDIDPSALPISPDDMLDAMLLRALPDALYGGIGPYLRIDGDDQRLVYVRLDGEGNTAGYRELKLQPAPPYLPVEIIDRSRDGAVLMHATLERYEPVEGGPLLARRYHVKWPAGDSQLDLDILDAKFRAELSPERFASFPEGWKHERIGLDPKPAAPTRSRAPSPPPDPAGSP